MYYNKKYEANFVNRNFFRTYLKDGKGCQKLVLNSGFQLILFYYNEHRPPSKFVFLPTRITYTTVVVIFDCILKQV